MRHFRKLIVAVTLVMAFVTVGCGKVDTLLGEGYLPDDQQMAIGELDLKGVNRNGVSIVSTRLFNTDLISTANQSYFVMGLQSDEEFGLRRSGFYSQYTPSSSIDDDDQFGYQPFLDSMIIYLSLMDYSGDTTYMGTFEVYEVIDDSFLLNSADTLYNTDFDIMASGALNPEPLFEFYYPDQAHDVYTTTTYVMSMNLSQSATDLGDRLMFNDGVFDYRIYNGDYERFVDNFKGIYVIPKESYIENGQGATYSFDISSSGFGFYGRSVYEEDPTIVLDTIGAVFSFRDANIDYVGGVSVQTIERDYAMATLDSSQIKNDDNQSVMATNRIYVEGVGGVCTELTFDRALFEELELVLMESDEEYTNLFFNSAYMRVYVDMADGESTLGQTFTQEEIEQMDLYPTRLGLYRTYSTFDDEYGYYALEGVADYDYYYEYLYSTTSSYNGYLNRSLGCYQMYIPYQLQAIWNDYLEAKKEAGGDIDDIDWEGADWNRVYMAPEAGDLFSIRYVTLQGGAGADNMEGTETVAPITLGITYTLLKR